MTRVWARQLCFSKSNVPVGFGFFCFFFLSTGASLPSPPEVPFGAVKDFLKLPPRGLDQGYLGTQQTEAVAELLGPDLGERLKGAVSLGGWMSSSEQSAFCVCLLASSCQAGIVAG